jgi:hypothetical protein
MMCLQVEQAIVTTLNYHCAAGSRELLVGYRTTAMPLATKLNACIRKKGDGTVSICDRLQAVALAHVVLAEKYQHSETSCLD